MSQGIWIYFADETYGHAEDDWEEQSEAFRKKLEQEYQIPLKEIDIGPGASSPAFFGQLVEFLPYITGGAIAVFFAGKKIEEGLEVWPRLFEKLKRWLGRSPTLDRQGASVLAINEVIRSLGKMPESIQLKGYVADSWMSTPLDELCKDPTEISDIEAEPKLFDSTIHVFQIQADDRQFKAFVYRTEVRLLELR